MLRKSGEYLLKRGLGDAILLYLATLLAVLNHSKDVADGLVNPGHSQLEEAATVLIHFHFLECVGELNEKLVAAFLSEEVLNEGKGPNLTFMVLSFNCQA